MLFCCMRMFHLINKDSCLDHSEEVCLVAGIRGFTGCSLHVFVCAVLFIVCICMCINTMSPSLPSLICDKEFVDDNLIKCWGRYVSSTHWQVKECGAQCWYEIVFTCLQHGIIPDRQMLPLRRASSASHPDAKSSL